jgi:hypothetical protein
MFRTYQGWTALTRQGKGDGTLLRAIQDDVAEDDLCGAQPGRALSISDRHHCLLIQALSSLPLMQPGDTVFWHSDVLHAVEPGDRRRMRSASTRRRISASTSRKFSLYSGNAARSCCFRSPDRLRKILNDQRHVVAPLRELARTEATPAREAAILAHLEANTALKPKRGVPHISRFSRCGRQDYSALQGDRSGHLRNASVAHEVDLSV